jgi:tRNA dimethylallyltransferase
MILRKRLPHYLIDAVCADKGYNVSRYAREAGRRIKEIISRRKTPLVVGGSGLYMSVLVDGIFKAKAESKILRRRLYKQAEEYGSPYLHRRLKKIDAAAAAKIHPNDTKRIIRALEVYYVTGKPISDLQKQRQGLGDVFDARIFCLNANKDELYKRIDKRVEKMFKNGLAAEVKRLLKLKLSKTASFAIGIRELKGYFAGEYGLDEAKALMKRNTRLYAKRQLTWFRKDKRVKWIEVGDKEKPGEIAEKIFRECVN